MQKFFEAFVVRCQVKNMMKCENFIIWKFIQFLVIIMSNVYIVVEGKPYKRVVIHVPMKVKHLHHTHTVYKPVHHAIPVKLDEHQIHLVRSERPGWNENAEYNLQPTKFENGRSIIGDLSKIQLVNANYEDEDRKGEYHDFENFVKKRSKYKQKLFDNQIIGWKGRPNFDKIANEFLLHIKNNPSPDYNDYDQRYLPYDDDDEERRKRK